MKVTPRYTAVSTEESRARADALIAWLRGWGARRLNSRLMDERRSIPPPVVLELGNRGLFGVQVEEKYGGLALRNRDIARVLEQAAAIDLGLGTWLLTSLFPGVRPIAAFGRPGLKDEVLPSLASGRMLAGYAQTEPGAGTHFSAMEGRAVAIGDGRWRLSGDKVWIGNSSWAGVLTVVAHDVGADGRRRGLTAFAVRTDRPGVALGREILSMGMRGMVQGEVSFRDVEVGLDDVVGAPQRGLEVGVDSMSWSRFAIAATCLGAMRRAVQLMRRFAGRRQIATGRLLDHPLAQARIGEASARIAALESLLYHVADALDADQEVDAESFAICKIAGSELLWQTVDELVQLLGSRGYDEANGVPQLLRDARVTRIFEGASEPLWAFVGAAALAPRSDLFARLDALGGAAEAERLAEAVEAVRGRKLAGEAMPRSWQCALAGRAATWALLKAAFAARPERALERRAQIAAWLDARFAASCDEAARGALEEVVLGDPAGLEADAAALCAPIGDVEQALPGERLELDPLLRRGD
jgi:alkylation response protein AidB-like acyl-CoA dehydrogenase